MYKPPGQKNEPSEPISISCRFVATDQWLRTHVDPHWTISELKRHLLAKCVGGVPLVPLGSLGTPGPRLLVPSQSGQITLASLVRPARTAPVRPGGRPSTAPHALLDDRRKPRLSLKVVPSLAKPGTISAPRTVTIHPPTPNIFGIPTGSQAAPSVYFSPRNPVSSPELSPPSFTPGRLEDEPSPPSPNMRLETMSMSSRSTVALGYTQSQPHSHTTSPTFSQGTSPPSRPFSPTLLPQPPESQPLFTPNSEHSMLFSEFASTTPSATGPPPSPYAPTTTRSPPPPSTVRSPPLSSSLTSRYEASISNADSSVLELDTQSRSHSPLLSAAEFFRLHEFETEPEPEPSLRTPSPPPDPSPPAFVHRPTGVYPYDPVDVHGISRKRSGSREKNGLEEEFRLVSFALGCIMDEHSTVADLRIRPGELLEIQRKNAIVHLARPTYTQPYFEAPIYMIKRTVTSGQQRPHTSHHHHHQPHIPSRPHQHHIQPHRDYASGHRIPMMPPIQTVEHGFPPQILPISPIESVSSAGARGRSGTVTARDRDPFEMDPELDESHDYAELDMSGLEGIGGGAPLPTGGSGGTTSGWSESSIKPPEERFEWKLRWMVLREGKLSISRSREKPGQLVFARPLSTLLSAQQLPATPQIGSLPRNYIKMHFTGPSRKERGRDAGIGIRMMDGAIHVHLLRVLLRIINTGAHAWLPTDTPIIAFAPLASQYPEWRQYIVQRAWLAGRGASVLHGSTVAGPWMRYPWLAWTDKESELFVDPAPSESDADYETDSSDEHPPALVQTRDSDSEIEWDNEAWRAWDSETTFGTWNTSNSSWLRLGSRAEMGRPRSRSLATPSRSSSQQQQQQQQMQVQSGSPHHETMLSPVSTSSEVSVTSPNTRRARSSTIAGPDSPGNSSPQPWARTGAGIETVLRAPASSEAIPTARRGSNNQTRIVPGERRGSAASMEMQRAMPPSRRAVTTPAQASVGKFL